eukprot:TRINITY_DN5737_c0_g1_i1.p1 TRINITY_DN5737_c0_g1~~TRINITY_DN5737_c0_g1_i1.p1  ORF type:complete len:103 (-),score=5.29 TRINITY_DN5737_c0_g1_i1:24-332(-)
MQQLNSSLCIDSFSQGQFPSDDRKNGMPSVNFKATQRSNDKENDISTGFRVSSTATVNSNASAGFWREPRKNNLTVSEAKTIEELALNDRTNRSLPRYEHIH